MVSIEDSREIPGLKPGYYVVVLAAGTRREAAEVARQATRAGVRTYVAHVHYVFWGCGE